MNTFLWIVQGVLALAFLAAGLMKAVQPKEKLAERMDWVEDFSGGAIRMMGLLEILAAIGLILPPLLDIGPILAPVAATGLVLTMLGAAFTHVRRGERDQVITNVVLGALALVVAWGRFGPHAF